MASVVRMPDLDDLIKRYEAGVTFMELCEETGVSRHTLKKRFLAAGVSLGDRKARWKFRPSYQAIPQEFIDRYIAGESTSALEAELWPDYDSSNTRAGGKFLRMLRRDGVRVRSQSAAERVKWIRIKAAGRAAVVRQLGGAWDAARGREIGMAEKRRKAQTRMKLGTNISPGEDALHAALVRLGVGTVQQFAIEQYNIDIAVPEARIAVEIFGGGWHTMHSRRMGKRIEELLDLGWCVLIVVDDHRLGSRRNRRTAPADWPRVADYVRALVDLPGRDEALCGRYGVVWSDLKPCAAPRYQLDGRSVIPGPERARELAADHRARE